MKSMEAKELSIMGFYFHKLSKFYFNRFDDSVVLPIEIK
jgi:hypothetical protein